MELDHTTLRLEVFQEVWNRLFSLEQNVDEALCELFVTLVVERGGAANVTDAAGTANAMNILVNATLTSRGEIVVNDMADVGDVNSTTRDLSGDQDRRLATLESAPGTLVSDGRNKSVKQIGLHGILTLPLRTPTVDEGGGQLAGEKVVVKHLHAGNGVDEDQSATGLVGKEQVKQSLALGLLRDKDDVLLEVFVSRTGATNTDAEVVLLHVLASEVAATLREGGREHHVKMIGVVVGVWKKG